MTQPDRSSVLIFSPGRWRLLAVLVFLLAVYALAQHSEFLASLDPYAVREWVSQWGALSALAFVALYAVGLLLFVPGTLFTVAGALLFGQLYGFFVVWIASNVAMNVSFITVRLIGGQPFGQVQQPLIRKMIGRLDDKPIQTIVVLRLFLFTAPALNTVLALCRVRGRDHVVGTLLGSVMPTATVVIATDWILAYLYA